MLKETTNVAKLVARHGAVGQIRNAFQTALALGHEERHAVLREAGKTPEEAASSGKKKWMTVKLVTKNFGSIARTTRGFEDYIVALRGKDSDAAREAEVRDDDYNPNQLPAKKAYNIPSNLVGEHSSGVRNTARETKTAKRMTRRTMARIRSLTTTMRIGTKIRVPFQSNFLASSMPT